MKKLNYPEEDKCFAQPVNILFWKKINTVLISNTSHNEKDYQTNPTGKMTVFGAIFEVNSCIHELWVLLGHFHEKDMVI